MQYLGEKGEKYEEFAQRSFRFFSESKKEASSRERNKVGYKEESLIQIKKLRK